MIRKLVNDGYLKNCPYDVKNPATGSNHCGVPSLDPANQFGYRYSCNNHVSPTFDYCTDYTITAHMEQSNGSTGTIRSAPPCYVSGCEGIMAPFPPGPEFRVTSGEVAGGGGACSI